MVKSKCCFVYVCITQRFQFYAAQFSSFSVASRALKQMNAGNVNSVPHMTGRSRTLSVQKKSGNGAIRYRRKLPSVEITLPFDMFITSMFYVVDTFKQHHFHIILVITTSINLVEFLSTII